MAALTTGLGGQEKVTWGKMTWILTGAKVYQGSRIGMIVTGANKGKVTKFTAASNLFYLGTAYLGSANGSLDATSADKALQVEFDRELTGMQWRPNGATPVSGTTHLLQKCYFADDNTVVPGTSDLGVALAGRVMAVDSVKGVLVLPPSFQFDSAEIVTPGPVLAYTANDCAIAAVIDGATYSIPTNGATAATITLPAPAALPDGIKATFIADGSQGGTIQYRDATGPVNLTAALTASKRHVVKVRTAGGKWYVESSAVAP